MDFDAVPDEDLMSAPPQQSPLLSPPPIVVAIIIIGFIRRVPHSSVPFFPATSATAVREKRVSMLPTGPCASSSAQVFIVADPCQSTAAFFLLRAILWQLPVIDSSQLHLLQSAAKLSETLFRWLFDTPHSRIVVVTHSCFLFVLFNVVRMRKILLSLR